MTHLNRFTCEEAFRRLDDYLDRALSQSEREKVVAHLEICASCTAEFNFESSVVEGVKRKLRQIEIPSDLLARLTSTIARASREAFGAQDGDD
ncbi:MAG: zf-HC2 domain-containing protein [Gemmatimonadota bacterium]|nr:zf-HC2 domain-containing protein [Gemmatimonadota bacterium]